MDLKGWHIKISSEGKIVREQKIKMEESQTFARHEYAQREFWNNRFNEYKSPFD